MYRTDNNFRIVCDIGYPLMSFDGNPKLSDLLFLLGFRTLFR